MADPITAGIIAGLAAQKFAEGAAGKAAEKLVEKLWDSIVSRFAGRKKTEENLATIAGSKGQAPEALLKVATVLEGEFVEDEDFASDLQQLAQQIIQIQNQNQSQTQSQVNFDIDARDNVKFNAVGRDMNATSVDFGK